MAHVFIAGVMQGSRRDDGIDDQDYRLRIAAALQNHLPHVHVTDPWTLHPDSVNYDTEQARACFVENVALAGAADVLIAYLPHASMGTAIELWTAHHNGTYVIAVTPLVHNWVVRLTADEILSNLESLLRYVEDGRLRQLLESRQHLPPAVDAADAGV